MLRKQLVALAALVTLAPVALAACGSEPSPSTATVDSLTVLDYYTDEPTTSQVQALAEKCGTAIGTKINRTAVPGPSLIQKVLQQASSKTLPDVLMLDNPDIQQIAATGALAPLGDYGVTTDCYATGPVSAATYEGK